VVPGFPERVWPKEQAELVHDFATAVDIIVTTMDVEEVHSYG
jgi:hypothetical protein